jgi:hypothetical protein
VPDHDIETIKNDLHSAFDRMIENIQAARDAIDTPELFPAPATERALADPLYPRFRRSIQPMNRSTINNSDEVYLGAEIDGNHSYLLEGRALDSRHWRGETPVEGPPRPAVRVTWGRSHVTCCFY